MYYDDDLAAKGIELRNVGSNEVTSVMQTATHALMALAEDKQMIVAKLAFGFFYKQPNAEETRLRP